MKVANETVTEHGLVIAPVVKVVSLNVPLHPDADETEYPVLAVTVKVAVWPWVTVTDAGEIDPLLPEAVETLIVEMIAGISEAESPPPPPQENNNGIMRVNIVVL